MERREKHRPDQVESDFVDALPSPFGWLSFAVTARGVLRVTIGHSSRQSALQACGPRRVQVHRSLDRVAALADLVRRQLEAYLSGRVVQFEAVPVDFSPVTSFQRRVYEHCRTVPYGATTSYGEVAAALGNKRSARAVGQALRRNPYAIIVPCHRILGADGNLTGFTAPGGLRLKERLLGFERDVITRHGRQNRF